MEATSQRKRIRDRSTCDHCGVNLGKSAYYEHVSVCPMKLESTSGNHSDGDSPFEPPHEYEESRLGVGNEGKPTTIDHNRVSIHTYTEIHT